LLVPLTKIAGTERLEQRSPLKPRPALKFAIRGAAVVAALVAWFLTQHWIAARAVPTSGIGDWTHAATASWNAYLQIHTKAANALLIVSSSLIDLMGVYLLGKWLVRGDSRPFLGLAIVLGLRQVMQACVALPAPPNEIWHNPGFPSLLVTYGVSNDFFFSAHTAISVLAGVELARARKKWLAMLGVAIVVFEATTVLVLRAHYAMDVFTGLVTGLYAAHLASRISTWLSRFLPGISRSAALPSD
jgi:hypothetical protein